MAFYLACYSDGGFCAICEKSLIAGAKAYLDIHAEEKTLICTNCYLQTRKERESKTKGLPKVADRLFKVPKKGKKK